MSSPGPSGGGITRPPDGRFSRASYVRSAREAGRTQNGVFAARNMWGSMTELTGQPERARPAREPHFDRDEVQRLVHLIGAHNAAWREWCDSAGIEPHPVRYPSWPLIRPAWPVTS